MYIGRPIHSPESRPESLPERAGAGVVLAVLAFAAVSMAASVVLARHGVALPCGDDLAANCAVASP